MSVLSCPAPPQVPNDFLADSCVGLTFEQACYDSVESWLTSIGLPMYLALLQAKGWREMRDVAKLREADFISAGVACMRHVRTLAAAVGALNVNIRPSTLDHP